MNVPTTYELARLAAILSAGLEANWSVMAKQAYALWGACDELVEEKKQQALRIEAEEAEAKKLCARLYKKPMTFPVSRGQVAKLLFPKAAPEKLRDYCRAEMRAARWFESGKFNLSDVPEVTLVEIDGAKFAQYRDQPMLQTEFERFTESFLKWHRECVSEVRRNARKPKSSKKKSSKKIEKKL